MKRIFEVLIGVQIILSVIQQYMIPSIKNSLIPFSNMDYTKATERLLKLAVSILNTLHSKLTINIENVSLANPMIV